MTADAPAALRFRRRAMGCVWELTLCPEQPEARAAAESAFEQVLLAERLLSVFLPSSDISRINREGHRGPVRVSPLTLRALVHALQLSELTQGAFDIACGALVSVWGFEGGTGRLPAPDELREALERSGRHNVVVDAAAGTVRLMRPGVRINPGGYGKGFGVDLALEALRSAGVGALGADCAGEPWRVGVRIPGGARGRGDVLELRDVCLSVSGMEEQSFTEGGRRFGHIIDPRTGWPVEGEGCVAALCASAAASDALATAAAVLGPDATGGMLEGRAEARVIFYDGMGRRVREEGGLRGPED